MPSLTAVIASTSGHTEFVTDTVLSRLKEALPSLQVRVVRAELATAADLQSCDVLLLGSGTWNTGGIEGQLNPHMHELLFVRAKNVQLAGKPVLLVSLGDDRYYYTTRCTEGFMRFLKAAGGKTFGMPLVILNEPYDKTERILKWADASAEKLKGCRNQ